MPNAPRLNERQYAFLRKIRNHPHGLPTDAWPNPAVLRRWLRHPRFRAALRSLIQTFRFQSDLLLASSAAHAGILIQSLLADTTLSTTPDLLAQHQQSLNTLSRLLRIDHLRQKERHKSRPKPSAPKTDPDNEKKTKKNSLPDSPGCWAYYDPLTNTRRMPGVDIDEKGNLLPIPGANL